MQHGALAWKLPAIQEAPPDTLEELETWAYIVENLIYLVGWVADITSLDVFHQRFWVKARKNRTPRPGYRNLTIAEYHEAYMVCQNQWRKASQNGDKIDDAILACVPPDNGELDVTLALAPRLAAQPSAPTPGSAGGSQAAHPHLAGNRDNTALAALEDADGPAAKRRRLSKAQRTAKKLQALEPALQDPRSGKGKAAGKGKPSGKGKPHGKGENEKSGSRGEWCRYLQETGNCPFGKRCWFRHT